MFTGRSNPPAQSLSTLRSPHNFFFDEITGVGTNSRPYSLKCSVLAIPTSSFVSPLKSRKYMATCFVIASLFVSSSRDTFVKDGRWLGGGEGLS